EGRSRHRALDLQALGTIDGEGAGDASLVSARLEQERYHEHRIGAAHPGERLVGCLADRGGEDRFEAFSRAFVPEYEIAHRRAGEGAGGAEEAGAEGPAKGRDRPPAGRRDRARDLVGIDDRRSEGCEARRDRALSRTDAAREADRDHAGNRPSHATTAT